jgi:hypothetical protein
MAGMSTSILFIGDGSALQAAFYPNGGKLRLDSNARCNTLKVA